jgi:hypothetical protein
MTKLLDSEPQEPVGTYQVWHKETDGFRHVANVEGGNLVSALVLSSLISKEHEEYKRVTPLVDRARANTFGDVIVNPKNVAYEIYGDDDVDIGFRKIDFIKEQFKAILKADCWEPYEEFWMESKERASARMEGREKEGCEI